MYISIEGEDCNFGSSITLSRKELHISGNISNIRRITWDLLFRFISSADKGGTTISFISSDFEAANIAEEDDDEELEEEEEAGIECGNDDDDDEDDLNGTEDLSIIENPFALILALIFALILEIERATSLLSGATRGRLAREAVPITLTKSMKSGVSLAIRTLPSLKRFLSGTYSTPSHRSITVVLFLFCVISISQMTTFPIIINMVKLLYGILYADRSM